jgi:hypothetical protein
MDKNDELSVKEDTLYISYLAQTWIHPTYKVSRPVGKIEREMV